MIGKVKMFDSKKRYGFITGDDGKNYYVSSNEVCIPSGNLDAGYTVFFSPAYNDYGPLARNVKMY